MYMCAEQRQQVKPLVHFVRAADGEISVLKGFEGFRLIERAEKTGPAHQGRGTDRYPAAIEQASPLGIAVGRAQGLPRVRAVIQATQV